MKKEIIASLVSNIDYLIDLITEITAICSPTGFEKQKAEYVLSILQSFGISTAYIDELGNVVYEHEVKDKAPLYCAHIDTVFGDIIEINPQISDNKIYAPSVSDNSMNVAALIVIIKLFLQHNIPLPTIFAFNVGEEGLGNLIGIKHIMSNLADKITAVVALDGSHDEFVNKGIGSIRYKIIVNAQGGHSWSDFGNSNAIAIASAIINDIYKLPAPQKTSYNVGTISGGTSVNTIAAKAEFLLDMRAERQADLDNLEKEIFAIINQHDNITTQILGKRPSGALQEPSYLEKRIIKLREGKALVTTFKAASTDSNIALSQGIPSLSFGIGKGHNVHTEHEYLELASLEEGLLQLLEFILFDSHYLK